MKLSEAKKLHADCSTLALHLSMYGEGCRRKYRQVLRFAFLACANGRDINSQTMGDWRREFLAAIAMKEAA